MMDMLGLGCGLTTDRRVTVSGRNNAWRGQRIVAVVLLAGVAIRVLLVVEILLEMVLLVVVILVVVVVSCCCCCCWISIIRFSNNTEYLL